MLQLIQPSSRGSTAGNWLFCNRRWLDPRDADDRSILEQEYTRLCGSFPRFAACTKKRFFEVLTDVCESWTVKTADLPLKAATPVSPGSESPALTPPPTSRTFTPTSLRFGTPPSTSPFSLRTPPPPPLLPPLSVDDATQPATIRAQSAAAPPADASWELCAFMAAAAVPPDDMIIPSSSSAADVPAAEDHPSPTTSADTHADAASPAADDTQSLVTVTTEAAGPSAAVAVHGHAELTAATAAEGDLLDNGMALWEVDDVAALYMFIEPCGGCLDGVYPASPHLAYASF
jgi:hypothetical protein